VATSISWTDSVGAATLTNGKPVPGDRFRGWTPDNVPVADSQNALADGALHVFEFRSDYIASFELPGIPNTEQALVLRLMQHLRRGGSCSVATGDLGGRTYGTCKLAPGTDPKLSPPDPEFIEYTLSLTLLNTGAASMICIYG
jgi:hypothetical protein